MKARSRVLLLAALLLVLRTPVRAAEAEARLYEVTTETGMPHLEENLRYATRVERACTNPRKLATAFWMLRDVSLQDCELIAVGEMSELVALYELKCYGGHGTTGSARWEFGSNLLSGTLMVRLGGKNMTFYQRITAKQLGKCDGR